MSLSHAALKKNLHYDPQTPEQAHAAYMAITIHGEFLPDEVAA